jgi:hypothetical protein
MLTENGWFTAGNLARGVPLNRCLKHVFGELSSAPRRVRIKELLTELQKCIFWPHLCLWTGANDKVYSYRADLCAYEMYASWSHGEGFGSTPNELLAEAINHRFLGQRHGELHRRTRRSGRLDKERVI